MDRPHQRTIDKTLQFSECISANHYTDALHSIQWNKNSLAIS